MKVFAVSIIKLTFQTVSVTKNKLLIKIVYSHCQLLGIKFYLKILYS